MPRRHISPHICKDQREPSARDEAAIGPRVQEVGSHHRLDKGPYAILGARSDTGESGLGSVSKRSWLGSVMQWRLDPKLTIIRQVSSSRSLSTKPNPCDAIGMMLTGVTNGEQPLKFTLKTPREFRADTCTDQGRPSNLNPGRRQPWHSV